MFRFMNCVNVHTIVETNKLLQTANRNGMFADDRTFCLYTTSFGGQNLQNKCNLAYASLGQHLLRKAMYILLRSALLLARNVP